MSPWRRCVAILYRVFEDDQGEGPHVLHTRPLHHTASHLLCMTYTASDAFYTRTLGLESSRLDLSRRTRHIGLSTFQVPFLVSFRTRIHSRSSHLLRLDRCSV